MIQLGCAPSRRSPEEPGHDSVNAGWIKPFLTERIEETLSGATAEVVVKVFGEELAQIDAVSSRVAEVLRSVEGAADVQQESLPGSPVLVVDLDRARRTRRDPRKV